MTSRVILQAVRVSRRSIHRSESDDEPQEIGSSWNRSKIASTSSTNDNGSCEEASASSSNDEGESDELAGIVATPPKPLIPGKVDGTSNSIPPMGILPALVVAVTGVV